MINPPVSVPPGLPPGRLPVKLPLEQDRNQDGLLDEAGLPLNYFHRTINTGQTTLPIPPAQENFLAMVGDTLDRGWQRLKFNFLQTFRPLPVLGRLSLTDHPRVRVFLLPHDPKVGWLMDKHGHRLGRVAANGDMRLNHQPGTWDFFNNPFIQPDFYHLDQAGRVGAALQEVAFERATQNNVVPYLRQLYPQLDGQGSRVGIIDFDPDHLANLQSVLSSPTTGIAPKAQLTVYPFERTQTLREEVHATPIAYDKVRSVDQLRQLVLQDFLIDFTVIQQILGRIVSEPQPPDAVVLSLTMERRLEYDSLSHDVLPTLAHQLDVLHPSREEAPALAELRQWVHAMTSGSETERQLSIREFVDGTLDQSQALNQAVSRYQSLTQKAAERGTLILVAAGNSQNLVDLTLPMEPPSLLNFMAASPYVLTIGGSDPMQTPSNMLDDKVAAFSNPALARQDQWQRRQVDLLAPGVLVPIDAGYLGYPDEQAFNNGTSLSVPWVAGIVCLMKQANPSLTLPQTVAILESSAVNPGHLPPHQVGYGFLDPVRAIEQSLGQTGHHPASSALT